MTAPRPITIGELMARYQVILLDAYGVLVDNAGALPGAADMLAAITAQGRRFLVVTNDASRLPETAARRFQRLGLDIAADQIVTSGSLIAPYFAAHGLQGARCMVLGTADSLAYVRQAGGDIVPVRADGQCDALIIGDESGFPFLESVNAALSALYRMFDRGESVAMILPNPDLVYPEQGGAYGFTSGAVALLLEAGLARRYPGRGLSFTRLGKPHRPLFDEARRRAGTGSMVMIGDQLETDIAGASAAGVDSALVAGGVSQWDPESATVTPTYLLQALAGACGLMTPRPRSSTP
jgi:HAD superfamily hydrolase (TIGR01459 family)